MKRIAIVRYCYTGSIYMSDEKYSYAIPENLEVNSGDFVVVEYFPLEDNTDKSLREYFPPKNSTERSLRVAYVERVIGKEETSIKRYVISRVVASGSVYKKPLLLSQEIEEAFEKNKNNSAKNP